MFGGLAFMVGRTTSYPDVRPLARRTGFAAGKELGSGSRDAGYEPICPIPGMVLVAGIVRPGIASGATSKSTPSPRRIAAVA